MLWEASAVDICFVLESSPASFSGGACIVFHTFLTHGICFLWHLCVLEWLSESLHTLSLCLSCLSLCLSCLSLCVSSFSAWLPIVTNLSVKFPGLKLRVCKKKTKIRYASLLWKFISINWVLHPPKYCLIHVDYVVLPYVSHMEIQWHISLLWTFTCLRKIMVWLLIVSNPFISLLKTMNRLLRSFRIQTHGIWLKHSVQSITCTLA